MTNPTPTRWFTIPQAAAYAGVSVKFIRTLIWSRSLRYTKAGKRFIVDRQDIDTWLESNKVSA